MDAAYQLMIMQQNAQQYQAQQHQQMMQMHNAPIGGGMMRAPVPSTPQSYGTQIIWRCGYDSQNRKVCWRAN